MVCTIGIHDVWSYPPDKLDIEESEDARDMAIGNTNGVKLDDGANGKSGCPWVYQIIAPKSIAHFHISVVILKATVLY